MARNLTPLLAVPPTPPSGVAAASKQHIVSSRGYLRVRLEANDDSNKTRVRPWFWRDGKWWPLRADGEEGVGTEPVTANPDLYNNKADQMYVTGGLSSHVVVVLEAGDVQDVEACYLDVCDPASA